MVDPIIIARSTFLLTGNPWLALLVLNMWMVVTPPSNDEVDDGREW